MFHVLPTKQKQACEDSSVVLFSLAKPTMCTKAVELGSGYGAGARYLAANFGAAVDCVDLSPEANALNRRYTEDAELSHLVHVLPPSTFFGTHLNTGAYGFCFSQDALCHAGKQTPVVLEEAARLLSSDSTFACSNILRSQEATLDELEGVYARLQLTYLETFESFVEHADAAGFDLVESLDKTSSMATHFQSLLEVRMLCVGGVGCARRALIDRETEYRENDPAGGMGGGFLVYVSFFSSCRCPWPIALCCGFNLDPVCPR